MTPDFNQYRRKLTNKSEPSEIVERLYLLAAALKIADELCAEVWPALDAYHEGIFEAALTENGCLYSVDFAERANRVEVNADAWQDEIDKEAA